MKTKRLWTEQSMKILGMLKDGKRFRVVNVAYSKTVDMMEKKTRRRWTFSTADFNRAKLALGGY